MIAITLRMEDISESLIHTPSYSYITSGQACPILLGIVISACHKSPVNRHHPMGHVPVSGKFERVAMDLLDVSVLSAKGTQVYIGGV